MQTYLKTGFNFRNFKTGFNTLKPVLTIHSNDYHYQSIITVL